MSSINLAKFLYYFSCYVSGQQSFSNSCFVKRDCQGISVSFLSYLYCIRTRDFYLVSAQIVQMSVHPKHFRLLLLFFFFLEFFCIVVNLLSYCCPIVVLLLLFYCKWCLSLIAKKVNILNYKKQKVY